MVFLLFDIETCPAGDTPSINDEVIGFGFRECGKDGKCYDNYIVTVSDYECNSISDCEGKILNTFLGKVDEYLRRAKEDVEKTNEKARGSGYSVLVIGWNIRSFDLPVLANRLYRQGLMKNIDEALELIGIKPHLIYLDLYDFIKSIIFPRTKINLEEVVNAASRCLKEGVVASHNEGEESKKSMLKMCRKIKGEFRGRLSDNDRNELGKYIKDRLTHDLNQLSILYKVLVSKINIKKCLMSELISIMKK
ncbi:hypothetical protein [Vulcanisaeta distributa]|uniref:Uncharacterized protein n=1 Tax=Vulcanisaeta distributa (strain DSM 14429 / JCM 11212 / NBRC 100878 / IC-017) TaxID=572478 RepID=E1QSD9_VULDI|nr:hypothetical protein [Vulcanisaeta distributa]ADN49532.1 hypothetical protein Vdis_0119 [Vulcanisaeta distributa DSM 14429]